MSISSVGSDGHMNCKSHMVDTLLFRKETLFHLTFRSAHAWPTATSAQSIFPSHSELQSYLPSHNVRYSDNSYTCI